MKTKSNYFNKVGLYPIIVVSHVYMYMLDKYHLKFNVKLLITCGSCIISVSFVTIFFLLLKYPHYK